jgi:ABC-type antimicrobial peptide transport system permease subunit
MINVFATSKHIHIRYDLKGSRIGRRVLTGKRDAEIMAKGDLALKDLDLEKRKEKIYVGDKNEILLKQIKNDADFLCKIGTNDYSLLLGIHYINKEKKNGQRFSFTNFVHSKTNVEDSIIKESSLTEKSCDSRDEKLKTLVDFEDGGIISDTGNEVYFIGIIDILTKFNWKKKCEHFAKMVRYCSNNMSCTPPQMYRDRFVNYMSKVIQKTSSFSSIKNPYTENLSNLNASNNNSSNNILIQNNTNNYFNIINNNKNITISPVDEINHLNQNQMSGIKKESYSLSYKLDPQEVIKEESEVEKVSVESFKKSNSKNNSSSQFSEGSDESKSNN